MRNEIAEVQGRINTVEQQVNDKVAAVERKYGELEVNTFWKLRDIEELLKLRVNETYVHEVCKKSEELVRRDLNAIKEQLGSKVDR